MSFQPHGLTEDKLESIYLENIDKIRKYDYSTIGLKDLKISESNIAVLLNNFRKYKIIGFNIGKFGDFIGAQRNFISNSGFGSPPSESKPSKYFSFLIYIIYVDIVGNCYGQIQSEKINRPNNDFYTINSRRDWKAELFVKPFSIPPKSLDITTDFDLIMKCISKNRLLEYSYPEYNEINKSSMDTCTKIFPRIFSCFVYVSDDMQSRGFSTLIGNITFKNIGNKCNERKRYKIEKIEEKQKLLEDKRTEEDKLESIYLENIDKIRKYDYSTIGLKDLKISESNIAVLLNNFRKYKIIGFNIGKFGDFMGAQRNYAPPGACNWRSESSAYFSFLIYIIYVDTVGNCYGQIQSEKVNSNSNDYFRCGYSTLIIDWNTELFVKPFSIPPKSLDITTDFDLIMKCISKHRLLEYSYPEYKEVYKSYICNKTFPNLGYDSPSESGFSNLICATTFKNIGNKCNEIKRLKIEKKQKIELEKKLLQEKRIEEEKKKIEEEKKRLEEEKKRLEEEKIFCRDKSNSLKPKYGNKIYYKFDEKNKRILYIGYSDSEIIDLSDFIQYTTKKNIFKGIIFESKIGNIEKIVFNNCVNLKRIYDFVEGLVTISINNCPNISEIDCYDKVKIWIDKECISIKTKFVTTSISDFGKIKQVVVEKPKVVKEEAKKDLPPDYLIDSTFSCEIMEDPVIASDGITYNRSEIEEWFKKHNTSPKTGEVLKSKNLIPNISIRNAIEEWKKSNLQ